MNAPSARVQRAKRILVYCQHLSGAGHFVRCREIVRALARRHHLWFMVGGPPVRGPKLDSSVRMVSLPAIHRTEQGVLPLDASRSLAQVFAERRIVIERLLPEIRPDVLIIEHFPFSKWLLREELLATINIARAANPQVAVVCSVRDYPAGHEITANSEFRNEVVRTLNQQFDQLLVHADPNVVTLESQFPWIHEINIPIHYTGYVAEKLVGRPAHATERVDHARAGSVLVSSGGLRDGFRLANLCVAAWQNLNKRGLLEGRVMELFAGLFAEDQQFADLEASIRDGPFRLHRFSDEFLSVMSTADLSISQGGYNTTMNVLQTRTRAILAPNYQMTDQRARSRLLSEKGLVALIDPAAISVHELAEHIQSALARPRPVHTFSMEGAEHTCDIITKLNR